VLASQTSASLGYLLSVAGETIETGLTKLKSLLQNLVLKYFDLF
jgi:hypothetical protein